MGEVEQEYTETFLLGEMGLTGVRERLRALRERLRVEGIRRDIKLQDRCLRVQRWGRSSPIVFLTVA